MKIFLMKSLRPAAPGEETVLNMNPLNNISSQIVEVFYPLSVAGTIIIPACHSVFNSSQVFSLVKELQPTLIWGSVRFYELMYRGLHSHPRGVERVHPR